MSRETLDFNGPLTANAVGRLDIRNEYPYLRLASILKSNILAANVGSASQVSGMKTGILPKLFAAYMLRRLNKKTSVRPEKGVFQAYLRPGQKAEKCPASKAGQLDTVFGFVEMAENLLRKNWDSDSAERSGEFGLYSRLIEETGPEEQLASVLYLPQTAMLAAYHEMAENGLESGLAESLAETLTLEDWNEQIKEWIAVYRPEDPLEKDLAPIYKLRELLG